MNEEIRDAEYCIDQYFESHLTSRLDLLISSRSAAKIAAKASGLGVHNVLMPSEDYAVSTALSFPANDIEKLMTAVQTDKVLRHDVAVLTTAWHKAVVAKVGQARYDELSRELGVDLATGYVSHRLMMRMVDYEVEKNPVRSSAEYILDEAKRSSMLSYLSPTASDMQRLIDKKVVARYNPSLLERGTGKVLGSVTDTVLTAPLMGGGSWARLGKFVAVDLGVGMTGDALESNELESNDVIRVVSAGLFDGNSGTLDEIRRQHGAVNPYSSETVKGINEQLSQKIVRHSGSNPFLHLNTNPFVGTKMAKLPEIPDYASRLREMGEMHFAIREHFPNQENEHAIARAGSEMEQDAIPLQQPVNQSVNGWKSLFDGVGLSGFSDVGKNLGYVLAMLPDVLVSMFTGKSRNLKFVDNVMPIAAIIAGMFVKNPLLKMLLVGFGGANLLNKAGHEVLENRERLRVGERSEGIGVKPQPVRQYREYADEPLDLRISNPVMKGNTLVVTIDDTPSIITICDAAVDAYYQGRLPLNTLANAVLRKYDEMLREGVIAGMQQQTLQQNYDRQLSQQHVEEPTLAMK